MSTNDFTSEQQEFDADMDYLRNLGAFMFDVAGAHLSYPSGATIYERLLADLSTGTRHALSPHGWTIDINWTQEVAA